MNLKPLFIRNLFSVRGLVFAATCTVLALAGLSDSVNMRAQQSIGSKAIVRHGFTINGRIEGSVQQLNGENTTLNGVACSPATCSCRGHRL